MYLNCPAWGFLLCSLVPAGIYWLIVTWVEKSIAYTTQPLLTGRSRVRFPMVSLEFFSDIILPVTLWPWGRLILWQKWVSGVFPGGKGGWCVRLTTLPPSCAIVMKSGNLNFLEPSGPLQACNGTAFTQPLLQWQILYNSEKKVGENFLKEWGYKVPSYKIWTWGGGIQNYDTGSS